MLLAFAPQLTTALQEGSTLVGLGESTLSTGFVLPRNGKVRREPQRRPAHGTRRHLLGRRVLREQKEPRRWWLLTCHPVASSQIITLWNQDTGAFNTDVNLYGSHPFHLELRRLQGTGAAAAGGAAAGGAAGTAAAAAAHGVFLLNSNGMDVELWEQHLTYRCVCVRTRHAR